MEDDTELLEDGEILEAEECDTLPAVPPHQFSVSRVSREPQTICSDESSKENSEESDDDSDNPSARPKRLKQVPVLPVRREVPNKYKVWSQALQEEVLTETLTKCDVEAMDRERSVESYNYKVVDRTDYSRYKTYDDSADMCNYRNADDDFYDEGDRHLAIGTKRRHRDIKKRLGKRKFASHPTRLENLSVSVDDSAEEVADDIAKKLNESKTDLILNVVLVLGKEKAIELYNETKAVEDNGGMLLMNGERRRTSGGVYLLLLKRDNTISSDASKKIFLEDNHRVVRQKKRARKIRCKKKQAELKETLIREKLLCLNTAAESKQPDALSGADDNLLEDGEVVERTVTNPPPSPVTDQDTPPPHTFSEDESDRKTHVRHLNTVTYDDDDCLDVNIEADEMDLF